MRASTRLAIVVGAAMMLGGLCLIDLTQDRIYLVVAAGVIAILETISALGRRFHAPAWLIHLWQLVAFVGIGIGLGLGAASATGPWWARLWSLYLDGVLNIKTGSAPLDPSPSVQWMFVLLIGLVTIVADVLVISLATPAWMIAPLLTLYLVPALALQHNVSWIAFAALAVAYLLVLAVSTVNTLTGWTRNLVSDTARRQHTQRGVWQMAGLVGIPVIAVSLLVGSLIPTWGSLRLQSSRPRGDGPIQLVDPQIQLNRNLATQSERVMLTYKTSQPDGVYLRLASLTRLSPEGWQLVPVDLKAGQLSSPPGQDSGLPTFSTTVSITGDFGSQYLPTPYPPRSFEASGQWGYDPITLMIVSTGTQNVDATRNLSYTVQAYNNQPDPADFASAQIGVPPDDAETTKIPDGVPQEISDLAEELTANASTPVLKAAAIQEYLRDPRVFQYNTQAPAGSGFEVMKNFLLVSREGYCIHFASAMALMARLSGIPARVSVGFLPGTKTGNSWSVQGRNMHAWPELYFGGYGWVRFEPTIGVATPPAWTQVDQKPNTPTPSLSSTPTPSTEAPTITPGVPTELPTPTPIAAPQEGGSFPWRRILEGLIITLLVVGIVLLPAGIRAGVRRRRLVGSADPHRTAALAWNEVRDTWYDLGHSWPPGSPREKVAQVIADRPAGAAELVRLGSVVERSRYAPRFIKVPADLAETVNAWRTEQMPDRWWRRLGLILWPRSLWWHAGQRLRSLVSRSGSSPAAESSVS